MPISTYFKLKIFGPYIVAFHTFLGPKSSVTDPAGKFFLDPDPSLGVLHR
jgi:hypothetical protein